MIGIFCENNWNMPSQMFDRVLTRPRLVSKIYFIFFETVAGTISLSIRAIDINYVNLFLSFVHKSEQNKRKVLSNKEIVYGQNR